MQQRAVEQIANVPQIAQETVEVVRSVPSERVQQRTAEVPMPQIAQETVEVWGQPRVNDCNSGPPMCQCLRLRKRPSKWWGQPKVKEWRTAELPMPEIAEETAEVVRIAPSERVQQWTPRCQPQIAKETVEVVRSAPAWTSATADRRGAYASDCARDRRSGEVRSEWTRCNSGPPRSQCLRLRKRPSKWWG